MKKLLILNLSILFLCVGMKMNSEECKDIVLGKLNETFGDVAPYQRKYLDITYKSGSQFKAVSLLEDGQEQFVKRGNDRNELTCDAEIIKVYYRSGMSRVQRDVTDIFKQKMK